MPLEPYSVFLGALGGAAWAITGYVTQKARPDNVEGFEPSKFGRAVLIGAALGAVAGPEMNLDAYATTFMGLTVTGLVEKAIQFFTQLGKRATGK